MEPLTKDEAVRRMIAVLNAEEPRHFHVGLVGYFIEGTPYSADALIMDSDSTMDLTATDDGFSCFAFLPPDRLAPETRTGLLVQQGPDATAFVTVRLDVKLRDVWLIAEIVDGSAQRWWNEPQVIADRKLAFLQELDVRPRKPDSLS